MEKKHLYRLVLSALLAVGTSAVRATELGDSIDTYQNQTVSAEVYVQGRTTLTMNSVTVTSTGELTATAPESIILNGPFEVQQGGVLEIYGRHAWPVNYEYDNSGNITARHRY